MTDFRSNIYLTFDIDWACDEILAYTLDVLEQEQIAATFFITHATPLLNRIRANPKFELGIHPNFQKLLDGNFSDEYNSIQIFNNCSQLVPEATSIRCHSLVQSTPLLNMFYENGITHEAGLLIPRTSGIKAMPFYHWNGLIRVPYHWEDDIHCIMIKNKLEKSWSAEDFLTHDELNIFNFHPIHLFLNTENMDRYEKTRAIHRDHFQLRKYRCCKENKGAFFFLINLISCAKKFGMSFKTIKEIKI